MERGHKWREWMVAGVACFGQVCGNMVMCWSSPMIPKLEDPLQSPLGRAITSTEASWIGSLLILGGVVGPFLGSCLASKLGRKGTGLLTCAPMLCCMLLLTFANNVYQIYIARFMGGVGYGVLFIVTFLYVGEIASDEVRGALFSFLEIFAILGILIIFAVGPIFSYDHVNYFCIASLVIFIVAFSFMPESPLYYLLKGRPERAINSLQYIRGKSKEGVLQEFNLLLMNWENSQKKKGSVTDMFATRGNRKALVISFSLVILQQLAGYDIILIYLMTIFESAKTTISSEIASITVGVVQLLASCITPFVVDKYGRRPLLVISGLGMAITWALFGMFFKLKDLNHPIVEKINFLPLSLLVLFMIVYCIGFAAVPFVLLGELFSINVKDFASSLGISLNLTTAFFTTRFFASYVEAVGMHNAFWTFASFCLLSVVFTLCVVPETKGQSYQQIQSMLNRRQSAIPVKEPDPAAAEPILMKSLP